MKKLKAFLRVLLVLFIIAIFSFVLAMQFYPEETSSFVGFRMYTVMSGSMEPTIPTYSLVISKMIDENEAIKPNTIITFQAKKDNENVLITHYFRKKEEKDGITYYRTQPERVESGYDTYETTRSDIIGTYVFHIPYLGKIFLFLKSPFGFIMYGELFVIWLVNKTIKTRWEEKDEQKQLEHLKEADIYKPVETKKKVIPNIKQEIPQQTSYMYLSDIHVLKHVQDYEVKAILHNETMVDIKNIFVDVKLFDQQQKLRKHYIIRVAKDIDIKADSMHKIAFRFESYHDLVSCKLEIVHQNCTNDLKK